MLVWQIQGESDSFEAKLKNQESKMNKCCGVGVIESIIKDNEKSKKKLVRGGD